VKEVLVRSGQHVDPGKVVVSIARAGSEEGLSLIAFMPGADRPRLKPHQKLRFTLPGYRGVHLGMEVRAVSADVLGVNEARARFLGDRLGESVQLTGTTVVIEARLSTATFVVDGEKYELHDGMVGVVEIQLESKSVLETLIPGLKRR